MHRCLGNMKGLRNAEPGDAGDSDDSDVSCEEEHKMKKAMILILLALASRAMASVTVTYDPGTTNVTQGLTGYSTSGDMMTGMDVTAFMSGGGSEHATWGAVGPGAGASVGTGWSLAESGDTFGGYWTLTNNTGTSITRLLIDAGPGDTVYDISWPLSASNPGPDFGTPPSAKGWTFQVVSDLGDLDILATYRDAVAVGGDAPVGDLFRYLDIQFSNAGGFGTGSTLAYISDTDNIEFAGDITPVPAPAALLLGSVGMSLVGWLRRRRAI
jgi:hypothetical protein